MRIKSYVTNPEEIWSQLKCGNCNNELDEFHSECIFSDKYCKFCRVEIIKSDYQAEYDKICEFYEKPNE